jgi:hypothetical protein
MILRPGFIAADTLRPHCWHAGLRAAASALLAVHALHAAGAVEAPELVPGESWQYSEKEGYSRLELRSWRSEVTAAGIGEVRMTVAGGAPGAAAVSEDRVYASAGMLLSGRLSDRVRGTFRPGLQLLPFPLVEGKTWSQTLTRSDSGRERTVTLRGKVLGWETVKVPAGEFRALKVVRELDLGDEETFRTQTRRTEYEWYVPELKSAARIEIWEQYYDPTLPRPLRYLLLDKRYLELVAYAPRAL